MEWNKIVNAPSGWWVTRRRMLPRTKWHLSSTFGSARESVWFRKKVHCLYACSSSWCGELLSQSCFYSTVVSKGILGGGGAGSWRPVKAPSTSRHFPLLRRSSCWKIIFMCQGLGHDLCCWQLGTFDKKQKPSLTMLLWKLWINHFHV